MPKFQAPFDLPPTVDDAVDELTARLNGLRHLAQRVMDTPVPGPRGQQLDVAEAKRRADTLGEAIDTEEAHGSQRHRRVPLLTRLLVLVVVVVVDFPIMLWLASSVFNVNWARSVFGLPLVISVVVSVLATGGAAAALYHLGHDQRQNKDHRRHLDVRRLTIGSKVSMLAVAVLVVLISTVAFYRVWSEGVLSGLDRLAMLLAVLVAVVMLISAWLVFWAAFRDGSPEQDDLVFYTRVVQRHLNVKRGHELAANEVEQRIEVLRRRARRADPRLPEPPRHSQLPIRHPSLRRPARQTAITNGRPATDWPA